VSEETQTTTAEEPVEVSAPHGEQRPEPESSDAELRSREAANYRTRLREAERQVEQRDGVIAGLRDELDRLHRAEVERVADQQGMAVPGDLWTLHQLGDLRDDDGRLDAEKVTTTVRDVLAARPTWRVATPDTGAGPRGGGQRPQPGLSTLLKPRRR
jgi:hypothetical protein